MLELLGNRTRQLQFNVHILCNINHLDINLNCKINLCCLVDFLSFPLFHLDHRNDSDIQLYEEVEIEYDLDINAAEMVECLLPTTSTQQHKALLTTVKSNKYLIDSSEISSSELMLSQLGFHNNNKNTSTYVFKFENITNVNINETNKKIRLIIKECVLNHEYNFVLMTNSLNLSIYFVIDNQNCILNVFVSLLLYFLRLFLFLIIFILVSTSCC